MATLSRLGRQIAEVTAALKQIGAEFALIGGLALASHKVIRATQDVDLLVDADRADDIDAELLKLGYHSLHRSADAGNYQRGSERVDFLYANRPVARRLLAGAATLNTSLGELRVISSKGLICSMNSSVNSTEAPFTSEGGISVPPEEPADPFAALDELMAVVEALCPEWPLRPTFVDGGKMLL